MCTISRGSVNRQGNSAALDDSGGHAAAAGAGAGLRRVPQEGTASIQLSWNL